MTLKIETFEIYCFTVGVVYSGPLNPEFYLPRKDDRFTFNKEAYTVTHHLHWDYDAKKHVTVYVKKL